MTRRPFIAALLLAGCATSAPTLATPPSTTAPQGPATVAPTPSGTTTTTPARCRLVNGVYPDPACNPGATNPRVTQDNLGQTVCSTAKVAGESWDRHERNTYLPSSVAAARKRQMLAAYNLAISSAPLYELDHRIPISVGGSPDSPANTWPEPWDGTHGAHVKDRVEVDTWRRLCAGQVTLAQAQAIFLGGQW